MRIAAEAGVSAIAKMIARKVIVGCAVPIPTRIMKAIAHTQARAFAVRIVRAVVMVSVLGLDDEEDEDSECCGDQNGEADPGEGDKFLFRLREVSTNDGEVSTNEGEVVVLARLLCM